MKILLLTPYFPPEMGAPQARYYELSIRLQRMGHDVTVLTGMPNYPTGKVFEGYRRHFRIVEEIEGVRVIRTWVFPSKSASSIVRMISSLSFVFSSVLLGSWRLGKQDVIVFGSPPLFIVLCGIAHKFLRRSRLVMYVADVWPDIFIRMGKIKPGFTLKMLLFLEKLGYRQSDVVAVTTPGAESQIRKRFPDVRTTVLSNGVDTSFFRPELRSNDVRQKFGYDAGDFVVAYIGLHGVAQGLSVVIEAASQMRDQRRIRFLMIGDGVEKAQLIELAKAKGLTNVQFCDPIAKADVPAVLASSDASLIPLAVPLPGTMPSKMYEALAAGVPALVVKHCEGEALVEKFEVGRTFEPMNASELVAAIEELASSPDVTADIRQNCRQLAPRFDRDRLAEWMNLVLLAVHEQRELPDVVWGGTPPVIGERS